MSRQIILDTETTGLYANDANNPDRLIEFAGLEMINRQLTGNYLHLYVHPQRDIPEEAVAVHGITLDQLVDKPVFAQVAQQIFDFLQGADLVIHNAKFDVGFLNAEFKRVGLPNIDAVCTITDTLNMAKEMYPGQKASLDALCNRLGVDRSKRVLHGALIDCELLAGVYLAMTRGQFSLVESLEHTPSSKEELHPTTVHQTWQRPSQLKIQYATDSETQLHEQYLNGLDKAVNGHCVYRANEAPKETAV